MGSSILTPTHLIFILLIALLLFGAKRLPEIGRSLGTGMREFKDSVTNNDKTEVRSELPPPAVTPAPPLAPTQQSVPSAEPQSSTERETETVS